MSADQNDGAASMIDPHPLAQLIPPMSDDEYSELRDDIAANGLRVPILLYEEKVLDGRHRLRACTEVGAKPKTTIYKGGDAAREVVSLNLMRRNLSTSQRGAVAVDLYPYFKERAAARQQEGQERGRQARFGSGGKPPEPTQQERRARDEAAAVVGVSGDTVYRAATIKEKDPDLFEQVKAGKLKINTAYNRVNANGAAPAAPKEPVQLTGRRADWAKAQRHRIDTMAGTVAALETELPKLKIAEALMTASQEDIQTWSDEFERAAKSLRAFARRLKEG